MPASKSDRRCPSTLFAPKHRPTRQHVASVEEAASLEAVARNSDLLYLCAVSRYDVPGCPEDRDQVSNRHKQYLIDHGWEKFYGSGKEKQPSDYRGVAYINGANKIIVIAHRGTKFTEGNIVADYFLATGQAPIDITADCFNFVGSVLAKAGKEGYKEQGYKVYQTGFSLGGFLAELGSAYLEKIDAECNGGAVSFDAPGSLPSMRQLLAMGIVADTTNKTIEYLITPANLVGCCNERMARVIRTITVPDMISHPGAALVFLREQPEFSQNTSLSRLMEWLGAVRTHDLNNLIAALLLRGFLSFTEYQEYKVVEFKPLLGTRPLNLLQFVAEYGSNAIVSGAQGISNRVYEGLNHHSLSVQMATVVLLMVGVYGVATHASDIGGLVIRGGAKLLAACEPYQKLLDRLHQEFGVVGFTAGAPRVVPLLSSIEAVSYAPTVP